MRTFLLLSLLMLPVTINAQTFTLPCTDASKECLERLTALAVANNQEIRLIEQTTKLQRRKMFTNYIGADSLNFFAMTFKMARNIMGGGDVQTAKLTINTLELRRFQLTQEIAAQVHDLLTTSETAEKRREQSMIAQDAMRAMVAVMEVGYRSGDGSTEAMMPIWEKLAFWEVEVKRAEADRETARRKLLLLVNPPVFKQPKKP